MALAMSATIVSTFSPITDAQTAGVRTLRLPSLSVSKIYTNINLCRGYLASQKSIGDRSESRAQLPPFI
jgi:hypothetical protein